jgi:hypothetical protein
LSETTNIPCGSIGEAWRIDADWIKEIALEQGISQEIESQEKCRRRNECLVGMVSV